MSDEPHKASENSSEPVHLNVLPSSAKADQLRQKIASDLHAARPHAGSAAEPTTDPFAPPEMKLLEGKIIEALRTVYDPEIPVSIYDLGLIYEIKIDPDRAVRVRMTLTAPACPVAGSLPGEVEKRIEAIPEVKSADVELVWEPQWDRSMMSEAALLQLGML